MLDVTDDTSVETAMGVIDEREGHLDVLVNNAGISAPADVNGPVALKVPVVGSYGSTEARSCAPSNLRL